MKAALRPVLALLALGSGLGARRLSGALPAAEADDGGSALPPGFRALAAADHHRVDQRVGNTPEKLRFRAVAPTGDFYAKLMHRNIPALRDAEGAGRLDLIQAFGPGDGDSGDAVAGGMSVLRKPVAKDAPDVTPAQIAGRRKEARSPIRLPHAPCASLLLPL
jgi:hypothetical protein